MVNAAHELGLDVDVTKLEEPTHTVAGAAEAVGCPECQVAKPIVLVADGEPVVCVVSGDRRVDPDRVCEVLDCAEVRRASADEVRAATGCPIHGVPPVGHGLPVVLDEALLEEERVYATAGDCNTLFEVDPRELVDRTEARVAPIGTAERRGTPAS